MTRAGVVVAALLSLGLVWGDDVTTGGGSFAAGAACESDTDFAVSECFDAGLSAWNLDPRWDDLWVSDPDNGEVDFDTSGTAPFRSSLYWSTATSSPDQCACNEFSATPGSGTWNEGIRLRFDPTNEDGDHYHVDIGTGSFRWRTGTELSVNFYEDIDTYATAFTGPVLCACVVGSGASETRTIYDLADFAGAQGTWPTDGTECDSDPNCNDLFETTGDPGQWGVSVGDYVGFRGFSDTQGVALSLTSYYATNINQAPVADAGGPYGFDASGDVDCSGSTDDGLPSALSYEWTITAGTGVGEACESATFVSSGTQVSAQATDTLQSLVDGTCTLQCEVDDSALQDTDTASVTVSTSPVWALTPSDQSVGINEGDACPTRSYTLRNDGASGAYSCDDNASTAVNLTGATSGTLDNGEEATINVVDEGCASLTAAGSPHVQTVSCETEDSTYTVNVSVPGTAITAAIYASRTTGPPPLGIYFDGHRNTTNASMADEREFHDQWYSWDFGAGLSGTFAPSGNARRFAEGGPQRLRVWEGEWSGDVTLTVSDSSDSDQATLGITVTDPDSTGPNGWGDAGETLCVSTDADFTGCPGVGDTSTDTGSCHTIVNNALASGYKRVLFKGGDSWNCSGTADLDVSGPGLIGAFGTGKPHLTYTPSSAGLFLVDGANDDWRIAGLQVTGGGGTSQLLSCSSGPISNILVHDVLMTSGTWGWFMQAMQACDGGNTTAHDGVIISEVDHRNAPKKFLFWAGTEGGVVGSYAKNITTTHAIRIYYGDHVVIENNDLGPADGATITVRSTDNNLGDGNECSSEIGKGLPGQFVQVSDNVLEASHSAGFGYGNCGGLSDAEEVHRDSIWEGNYFRRTSGSNISNMFSLGADERVTARNMLISMDAWGVANPNAISVSASDSRVYNISCWDPDTNSNSRCLTEAVDGCMNIAHYAPNASNPEAVGSGACSGGIDDTFASKPFTGTDPGDGPSAFTPVSAGDLEDQGIAPPVREADFLGNPAPVGSAHDIGGIERQ